MITAPKRQMFIITATVLISVGLINTSCSGKKKDFSKKITRAEYGNEWPFTVDEVYVDCNGFAVTVKASGITYGVNGRAIDTHEYSSLESIWARDTSYHTDVVRKDIGAIIDVGLEICMQKSKEQD